MSALELGELRIADMETFLAVRRHGSLTGAARDLKVTPSQISKAVGRLERYLKRTLLLRKARGVALAEAGTELAPRMEELVEGARRLRHPDRRTLVGLTLAAPSYLGAALLPVIVKALPETRVRVLEGGPAFLRAYASERIFDAGLTLGEERMPPAWVSTRVGDFRKGLFASPVLARRLGSKPSLATLRGVPFVNPVYNSGGQFMPGVDGCPLGRSDRTAGHEAMTIGVALEVAAASHQLAFGPVVAARSLLREGKLVEVVVPGWRVIDSLFFHANGDVVLARVQKTIVEALRKEKNI